MPAFDRLGSSTYGSTIKSNADVIDIFAHQFPNAEILHLTPEIEATRELLRSLGGSQSERRRFQRITPHSHSSNLCSMRECVADWGGLVTFEEPKDGDYDVVVISEPVDYDIARFLKPDGFVIVDNITWDSQDLLEVFKHGAYSSYRNRGIVQAPEEEVTLLVSTHCTTTTQAMVSAIKDLYKGVVRIMSITDAAKVSLPPRNIISLVSLDEDLFFEASADNSMISTPFRSFFKFLTTRYFGF